MNFARNTASSRLFLAVLFSLLSVVVLESVAAGDLLNAPKRIAGLGRVASSLDDFKRTTGLVFKNDAEAAKAFEWYKRAANSENGLVIGHGNAAIDQAHSGWEAFRMLANADAVTDASVRNAVRWTENINLAWIDGAIDAGKPIRLATPFDEVYEGTITWIEIMRIRSRGGTLILDGR